MRIARRAAWGLAIVLVAGCASAADLAPKPESPCQLALDALHGREEALLAQRPAAHRTDQPDPEVLALKHRAARACLGAAAEGDAATRRSAPPPAVAPPITLVPPPAPKAVPPLSSAPPIPPMPPAMPPSVPRPPALITACDAAGCWTSEGARLPRVGPNLLGPRGLCTAQGAVLVCP